MSGITAAMPGYGPDAPAALHPRPGGGSAPVLGWRLVASGQYCTIITAS